MTSVLERTDVKTESHISFHQWVSASDFASGTSVGATLSGDRVVVGSPETTVSYQDPHDEKSVATYEVATWTSPEVTPGFPFTELVASWNTVTPPGTWVETTARVVADDGTRSKSYSFGRWSMDRETINRTSVPDQGDDLADVSIDVLVARSGRTFASWQLTVSLHRLAGTEVTPEVSLVAAVASALPWKRTPMPKRIPASGSGVALDVPTYSQELHIGKYAQFSGGGESWCSPTSTAMVLTFFGAGPDREEFAWIDEHQPDPMVVHAAAHTYDWEYGAGNWPFNTAYAGEFGLRGFVTRLRSLNEAEQFIAAGIPLIASVSFEGDELSGAGYSTEGHLMVIVGFTGSGDVIVNDPASHLVAENSAVRMVYDRGQFRSAWLMGSGGIVYVIRPPDLPLPPPPPEANW
jgi:peptidase C39-like protein